MANGLRFPDTCREICGWPTSTSSLCRHPIDASKQPDLEPLKQAHRRPSVAALKRGDIVVYESTVYPGVTEEICIPVLEQRSGPAAGSTDFNVGYSPERINPGDKERTLRQRSSRSSPADTPETLEIVDAVYRQRRHGRHRTARRRSRSPRPPRCIENTQRDVNIALINELAADLRPPRHRHRGRAARPPAPSGTSCRSGPAWSAATASASTRSTSRTRPRRSGYHPQVIHCRPARQRRHGRLRRQPRGAQHHARAGNGRPLGDGAGRHLQGERARTSATPAWSTSCASSPISASPCSCTIRWPTASLLREEYGLSLTPLGELKPADAVVLAVAHRAYRDGGWDLVQRSAASPRRLRGRRARPARPCNRSRRRVTLWRL